MITNEKWHTATIAEIFAEQGYFNYSKIIYENLLKKEPNNIKVKNSYNKLLNKMEIEALSSSSHLKFSKELVLLFSEWIELIFKEKRLKDLEEIKKKYIRKSRNRQIPNRLI